MKTDQLLLVAGEASGDQHGADLLAALLRRQPELQAFGMGGSELERRGLDRVADSSDIAVVGLVEALRVLRRARRVFKRLLEEVDQRRPAVAVLIDSPDFNLRLARQLARRGVRVVYYVSPQVWAWRSGRVKTIARYVDRMLVLFGFERDWYAARGVRAVHVGHPLLDQVVEGQPQAWDSSASEPEACRLALLPGSRPSEVTMLLPIMLRAARRLARRFRIELQVIKAPDLSDDLFTESVSDSGLPARIVRQDRQAAIAGSHLALCASGTATLEVGLLGTPMVVVYRVKRWSYWLGRLVIEVPYISLVNLVLGSEVVPEMVQHEAEPAAIAACAERLLADRLMRDEQRSNLRRLRSELGDPGGSERAADEVLSAIGDAA